MSETITETAEAPADARWDREVDQSEVAAKQRDPSHLTEAAKEAYQEITRVDGAEIDNAPEPKQSPETAANRAAAVAAARAGAAEAVEDVEPVSTDEAEAELPPPAPAEWLDEEVDFEAEARAELAAAPEPPDPEDFTEEEYVDPRLEEERVKRLALEKRLAHVEAQRLKDARKGWVAEALEHAPLAKHEFGEKLDGIEASSKREFLKKAAAGHNKILGIAQALAPNVKAEVAQVKAEAKAAAQAGYGKPTAGPGSAPARAGEEAAKVVAARERKGLAGGIRALMDQGVSP